MDNSSNINSDNFKNALEFINQGDSGGLDKFISTINKTEKERKELLTTSKNEQWIDSPIPDENGKTLVLLAIEKNQLECLKILLISGGDSNLYLQDLHMTPLMFATQMKNLEIMKYLIENYSVDVNFQTEESMSPLHEACAMKGGFTEGVNYLVNLPNIQLNEVESEKKGHTPLFCAVEAGNVESVKLLIDNGADLKHMEENGKTLLLKAIDYGQIDCIRALVKGGADLNGYTKEIWFGCPLTFAMNKKKYDCMKVLLEEGANPNYIGDENETFSPALIKATKADDLDAIKLLIDFGADIKLKDTNGYSPLIIAIKQRAKQATITYLKQVYEKQGIELTAEVAATPYDEFLKENLMPPNLDRTGQAKEYIECEILNIFCGTWNINGSEPPQLTELNLWLGKEDSPPPDIYAVAYQELVTLNAANIVFDSSGDLKEKDWLQQTFNSFHPKAKYKIAKWMRLTGIMLIVCVREDKCLAIKNIAAQTVGTGGLGFGNKGGVAIRLEYERTSLCFVSSHLAAHTDGTEKRNKDYQEICKNLIFDGLAITDHDMVFWMGDLNYRIEGMTTPQVKESLENDKMDELLLKDQLRLERSEVKVFSGFQEGRIKFKPTYKYDPGTDSWDTSDKSRAPAWCDRILWKGENIHLNHYSSHMELKNSDHKPVSAAFNADVKVVKTWEGKMEEELSELKEKVIKMSEEKFSELEEKIQNMHELLFAINGKLDKIMSK